MSNSEVKTATELEQDMVIDSLKLAFGADPATRWVWPDPQKYLLHFSKFAKAFGGKAFANRVHIMLEIMEVLLFGFRPMLIPMLKLYLVC